MARRPEVFVRPLTMEEGRKLQRITRTANAQLTGVAGLFDGDRRPRRGIDGEVSLAWSSPVMRRLRQ